MAVIKYKDPNTGEYISEVYVESEVSSVNGETGAVTLDAEKIEYDPDAEHVEGSVGAELSSQSSAIANINANKTTSISSVSTDTQYPSAKSVYDYAYCDWVGTQAEYDAIALKDSHTIYNIVEDTV